MHTPHWMKASFSAAALTLTGVAPAADITFTLDQPAGVSRGVFSPFTGKPLKLLRRRVPLSRARTNGINTGGIQLEWSTFQQPSEMVPTANLHPITPR
jgi:hypothetical protein